MKLRNILLGLSAVLWFASGTNANAVATFTICNKGKTDLRYAIVWQSAPRYPRGSKWKAWGWRNLKPGCFDILRTNGAMEAFIAVRKRLNIGDRIMNFPFDSDKVRRSKRNGFVIAERFFCVKEDPFERELSTLEAHERCPAGYYLQLFNLLVTLDPRKKFTLTLNK